MSDLPVLSGKKIIRALAIVGYKTTRRRSSHVRLICEGRPPITVPDYKTVSRGLLRKILRDAQLTKEEFVDLLK
ncbi:MAG: type II toxin-antitoxin system HicA family toxin [bacterium]|nr:type II toxin-antitoxin system HicA family toxin [bacterium]